MGDKRNIVGMVRKATSAPLTLVSYHLIYPFILNQLSLPLSGARLTKRSLSSAAQPNRRR